VEKAMRVPSGDQYGSSPPPRLRTPLPSAFMSQSVKPPSDETRPKAIRVPSGAQAGARPSASLVVMAEATFVT